MLQTIENYSDYNNILNCFANSHTFENQTYFYEDYPNNFVKSDQYSTGQYEYLLYRLELSGRVPSKEKFRRMACVTCISCGGCPYNDRCVFLHDPRTKLNGIRLKASKTLRNSSMNSKDSFYWPDMKKVEVFRHLDIQGLPDSNQRYEIPETFSKISSSTHHDRAVFSIWNHFISVCCDAIKSSHSFNSNNPMNYHVKSMKRLRIFIQLSNQLTKSKKQDDFFYEEIKQDKGSEIEGESCYESSTPRFFHQTAPLHPSREDAARAQPSPRPDQSPSSPAITSADDHLAIASVLHTRASSASVVPDLTASALPSGNSTATTLTGKSSHQ